MLLRISEITLLPIAWAAIVLGALQTKALLPDSQHTICGPWGCGPDTGALIAMHTVWLAILGPPLIYLPLRLKLSTKAIRRLALAIFSLSIAGIAVIAVWQWLVWLPQAGAWSRDYIWQRCGFAILTTVDFSFIAPLVISILLKIVVSLRRLPKTETLHSRSGHAT